MLDQSTAPKAPAFLSVSNYPATVTAASCVKKESATAVGTDLRESWIMIKRKNVLQARFFAPKHPDIRQQDDVDVFSCVIVGVPERSPNSNKSISQQSSKRPAQFAHRSRFFNTPRIGRICFNSFTGESYGLESLPEGAVQGGYCACFATPLSNGVIRQ